jgi:hypothetical protein
MPRGTNHAGQSLDIQFVAKRPKTMTPALAFLVLCLLFPFTLSLRSKCQAREMPAFASAYAFLSCLIAVCVGLELTKLVL